MEHGIGNFLESWSYLGLFSVLLVAGFGLPIPEDVPLIISGLLVGTSKDGLNLYLMMLTGLAGVLVGDSTLFFLGRRYGMGIMQHRLLRWMAKPWLLEKARKRYENNGARILFAARFMPGLRAVLFLTAGIFRVPYWRLLVFDGGAALISVPLWIWAGYYFGKMDQIQRVFKSAEVVSYVVIGLTVAAVLFFIIRSKYRKRHPIVEPDIVVQIPIPAPSASPGPAIADPMNRKVDKGPRPVAAHPGSVSGAE